jgi:hypothetical protein
MRLPSFSPDSISMRTKSLGLSSRLAVLILGGEPIGADHREQHVASIDLVLQHAHEVQPRLEFVDVDEDAVGGEGLFQPVEQTTGEARVVPAPR